MGQHNSGGYGMVDEDGLPFAQCPNCSRRYPCAMDECRALQVALIKVWSSRRPDGTAADPSAL